MKPKLTVLVSGSGRSLENLSELVQAGELDVELTRVISDRSGIQALERADRLEIEACVIERKQFSSTAAFSTAIFAEALRSESDLVVLAGFLRLLTIPVAWQGRVLNIHPSLLPAFGGKGYYGEHVHRAVLKQGEQTSGCTVHYVDNQYDSGPILLQRSVPVLADDTVESLAARVFEAEKQALPEAIRMHFAQRNKTAQTTQSAQDK